MSTAQHPVGESHENQHPILMACIMLKIAGGSFETWLVFKNGYNLFESICRQEKEWRMGERVENSRDGKIS